MSCEECTNEQAWSHCVDCEQRFCRDCEEFIHQGGKRRLHSISRLCSCGRPSEFGCSNCSLFCCSLCAEQHEDHELQAQLQPERVAVYWDLTSCPTKTPADIAMVKESVEGRTVHLFKAYREHPMSDKWASTFENAGISLETREGSKEIYSILLDIPIDVARKRISYVLIIGAVELTIKQYLTEVERNFSNIKIAVSVSLTPLQFVRLEELQEPLIKPIVWSERTLFLEACPIFQSFPRFNNGVYERLIGILKTLAEEGHVDHQLQLLIDYLNKYFEKPESILSSALSLGLLHSTEKTFGDMLTVNFVGMRLDSLSLESLIWTLRSLRHDEMLPVERAIQSRMKEAFDLKPSTLQWQNLLEAGRSAFADQRAPELLVKRYVDPMTGNESRLIYPAGEEWLSYDQKPESTHIRESYEWRVFAEFMDNYFVNGDESKALSGGRYGCAQFLQLCGGPELCGLSLGKLSYMVQLAINEGLFRYHKTLLVWNSRNPKPLFNSPKLISVQQAIIEVLREGNGEVPLAQLPLRLKKALGAPLNLKELGFAKLKDLLCTIQGVTVELRGTNYPFAVIGKSESKESTDHSKSSSLEEIPKNRAT